MAILSTILVGLIVGAIAKLLMPGKDPGGFIITILLGIAGAFIAITSAKPSAGTRPDNQSGLDHVGRRRHDSVAAVSIPFQTRRLEERGHSARCRWHVASGSLAS